MIILMTFLKILENFAYINYTLVKQKSNYLFCLFKISLHAAKTRVSTIFYGPN